MKRTFILAAISLTLTAAGQAHAQAEDGFRSALDQTTYLFNWRVRHENVDQVGFDQEANALTSRVRAGFESGSIGQTRLLAEMVATAELSSKFNSTTNGQTDYPVVADPGGFARINRFAIINQSLERTTLSLGRQRLILDDSRFVGNVGWRQNEQTFDGLTARMGGESFSADFAYFNQVNRILGPDSPQGVWNGDVFLLNASRSFSFGKLTGFAYGMEFDEAPAASNETIGLRLTGSRSFGDTSLIYTLSLATQNEAGLNPVDYSETYTKAEAGVNRGRFTVALGHEVLGGDGSKAFVTPLATLHAFQGWADKFLLTPADGIEDAYLRFAWRSALTGPFDSVNLTGFLHQFESDLGSTSYGDELNLSVAARAGRVTLILKYASYDADAFATDTDKLWFSMDYAF